MLNFIVSIGEFFASLGGMIVSMISRTIQALGILGRGFAYIQAVIVQLPPIFVLFAGGLLAVCVVHIILEVI